MENLRLPQGQACAVRFTRFPRGNPPPAPGFSSILLLPPSRGVRDAPRPAAGTTAPAVLISGGIRAGGRSPSPARPGLGRGARDRTHPLPAAAAVAGAGPAGELRDRPRRPSGSLQLGRAPPKRRRRRGDKAAAEGRSPKPAGSQRARGAGRGCPGMRPFVVFQRRN